MTDLLDTLVRVGVHLRSILFTLDHDQYIYEIDFVRLSSGIVSIFYL